MENKDSLEDILKRTDELLKNSNKSLEDSKAMDEAIAFAIEQWIKTCIEFA